MLRWCGSNAPRHILPRDACPALSPIWQRYHTSADDVTCRRYQATVPSPQVKRGVGVDLSGETKHPSNDKQPTDLSGEINQINADTSEVVERPSFALSPARRPLLPGYVWGPFSTTTFFSQSNAIKFELVYITGRCAPNLRRLTSDQWRRRMIGL